MMDRSIGFVGGGRVATILLGGWARAGVMPSRVCVSDADDGVLSRLKGTHGSIDAVGNDNARAAGQEVVFLALHPPAIPDALPKLKSALNADAVLVSLAPKLTIARLTGMLDGFGRIARTIPNAASIVCAGYNPIAFGDALSADDRAALRGLFLPLGKCVEVPEETLEAYAILTAMGPTYLWPQLYELQSLGESFGLEPAKAAEGVREMVVGTLAAMYQSGLDAGGVVDLIPVKPLADLEPTIIDGYRTKLTGLMGKIRP